jgi:hypothetical protein
MTIDPTIKHERTDADTGGKYIVLAYQKLSPKRVDMIIRTTLQRRGTKQPKRGRELTIYWLGD